MCDVISFDLKTWDGAMEAGRAPLAEVWYGLPGREAYSAQTVVEGLDYFGHKGCRDHVLWFQHEHGIWRDDQRFIQLLRDLRRPTIVTLHTLHFQSRETLSGLRENQVAFLRGVLPCVDAITVFTQGVYRAVASAFPEYAHKVHILEHGVHCYRQPAALPRWQAKAKLHDFLVCEGRLDEMTKADLVRSRALLDPDTIVIGQAGFLDPSKQSELLYWVRDELSRILPYSRVVAMRVGSTREASQRLYAQNLWRNHHNGVDSFLLETLLTEEMLPMAQRAFDVNFYWPRECTQSGALSHALGAGALIAGRDLEGVGETLGKAGQIVDSGLQQLLWKIRDAFLNTDLIDEIENCAAGYASKYSWMHQTGRHFEIADSVLAERSFRQHTLRQPDHDAMSKRDASRGLGHRGVTQVR
jgi:hypothetical protein